MALLEVVLCSSRDPGEGDLQGGEDEDGVLPGRLCCIY